MSKPFVPKAGTTAECAAFTGLENEVVLDEEKGSLIVHDGVTAGGAHEILPKAKNDELYAPKDLDVGVTSVNGNAGDITPEQTGCLPLSGGTMTADAKIGFASYPNVKVGSDDISFFVGNNSGKGALARFFDYDDASNSGGFQVRVADGTTSKYMFLKTDGTFQWDGKQVERVNATVFNSDSEKNPNYIRYENGLQICWGFLKASSSGTTLTFPVAFKYSPQLATTPVSVASTPVAYFVGCGSISTTGSKLYVRTTSNGTASNIGCRWIAVGCWK